MFRPISWLRTQRFFDYTNSIDALYDERIKR